MADFRTTLGQGGSAPLTSIDGIVIPAPTPPSTVATALAAGSPALGLGLTNLLVIVAGNVAIEVNFPNAIVQRR